MDDTTDGETPVPTEPSVIKTYSLEEVAAMVLPPDMSNAVRWLTDQIRSGKVSAG